MEILIHSLSAEFRALIRGLLSSMDATLFSTSSREELFERCRAAHYDLLLTDDARMFMNGTDAMSRIRCVNVTLPVFILSYNLTEESVTALLEEGVNQFISLPVAVDRLRRKVESQYCRLV